ncbi:thiamine phosphate synthase [Hyphococcus sp.]|uniref:thiamine phosphate synthase n=1 Tax=Hyphococcus sp. TaxID=2038636 RepID=UPI003CCBB646
MRHDCRLYLISPPQIDDLDVIRDDFARALGGGDIACFQLRLKTAEKPASDTEILRAAETLIPLAREHDVAFLINDRPDLAVKCGADGVHVGQSDASCKKARTVLGDDATIGVTCHNSKHLALQAGEAGADYVAFGAFFPTATKAASTKAEPSLVEWWSFATTLPCVAIGGITPENCGPLVRAGADFLAASAAVWNHADGPAAAVKSFNAAIKAA